MQDGGTGDMRGARISILTVACLTIVNLSAQAIAAGDGSIRYRGQYTYGHEVNIFCPAIKSQCYWLSGDTPGRIRGELQELYKQHAAEPYEPVCMIVEGLVDKDTVADGFAADYDGLIQVTRVFGRCVETSIVTHGDLQHHRWLLESINGAPISIAEVDGKTPALEIGEQMQVSGNLGCNQMSGKAVLREEYFVIEAMISTMMSCTPPQNELERLLSSALSTESVIRLDDDRNMTLESAYGVLEFRLQDRVN